MLILLLFFLLIISPISSFSDQILSSLIFSFLSIPKFLPRILFFPYQQTIYPHHRPIFIQHDFYYISYNRILSHSHDWLEIFLDHLLPRLHQLGFHPQRKQRKLRLRNRRLHSQVPLQLDPILLKTSQQKLTRSSSQNSHSQKPRLVLCPFKLQSRLPQRIIQNPTFSHPWKCQSQLR